MLRELILGVQILHWRQICRCGGKKQVDRVFEVLLFCDQERASFNHQRVNVSGEKVKLNIVLKSVSCIVYRVSISKKLQAKSR